MPFYFDRPIAFELQEKSITFLPSWKDKAVLFGCCWQTQFANFVMVNWYSINLKKPFIHHYKGLAETSMED